MKHGERLACPVFLVQSYLHDNGDRKFGVVYDISCLLSMHLKTAVKNKIVALFFLKERATSEMKQVAFDKEILLRSLAESSKKLKESIHQIKEARSHIEGRIAYNTGAMALLNIAVKKLDTRLDDIRIMFQVQRNIDDISMIEEVESADDETEEAYDAELNSLDDQEDNEVL